MEEVVIYTRFSPRPNAPECDSCDKQEERCLEFLKRHSLLTGGRSSPVDKIRDENVSGGVFDRPGLNKALGMMKSDSRFHVNRVLLVDSADRLARDVQVACMIKQQVAKCGARILYANGVSPTDSPEGKFVDTIMDAVAAFERDRIRAKTRAGLARKAAQGVYLGKVPIGYMRNPETKGLVVCPDEHKMIADAKWQRAHYGLSSKKIAYHLQISHGNLRGNTWSDRTVRKILKPGRDQKILARIEAAKSISE